MNEHAPLHGENPGTRVLLVFQDEQLASSRVRILRMAPRLEEQGIATECLPYPRDRAGWGAVRERARSCDAIVLQKKLPSLVDALRWGRLPAPIVYDFDDAVPLRQRPRRGSWDSRTRARRFRRVLGLASGVIAGNDYLASLCGRIDGPVLVAPSPVPHEVPTRSERGKNDPPRVGWIGGKGNLDSLLDIQEPLRRASAKAPFDLVVISDGEVAMEGCRVEHVAWSVETQEHEIARLDVGLMPLRDSPWSRGKCAYKALQYMAAGVPTVASPVGMNPDVVTHGENGLLAATEAEWEEALALLLGDGSRADELGDEGRKTVLSRFTYEAQAARWAEFLRGIAKS